MTYRSNRPAFVSPFEAVRTCLAEERVTWFERHVRGEAIASATSRIYEELFAELTASGNRPLRVWNHVPTINSGAGPDGHGGEETYKIFNAARYRAWSRFDPSLCSVCAGTAVGSADDVLSVYAIAVPGDVCHHENPRQTPFLQYSSLYGTPPCSRRATSYGNDLFIAGTASIVGEATVEGGTDAQLAETLRNLRALLDERAFAAAPNDTQAPPGEAPSPRHLHAVRVYVRDSAETDAVGRAVAQALQLPAASVVAMTADICRLPLRLEVELVASAR